ncbi:hypothetical protein M501DRAFT_1002952 [Patellaria atrata CBS 101060]|uniref:Up-regulated during septation protein 1 domain-containing protein n=1 Tax=Patellaria atrata CBS 101060 TaxID=1346257 RepID=A0A9P4VRL6_9PEZI|nr:hypothetical protein M501DRAFT_1002952 [Patellaria atrata CBS 101060]
MILKSQAMTHIANCMRLDTTKANVYIGEETSWLRNSYQDEKEVTRVYERRPSGSPVQPTSATSTSRYQLWPTSGRKSPSGLSPPLPGSEKSMALSMGRSPTSLSDTAVAPPPTPGALRSRAGSLSRRRKVSVPELGASMTTVQETALDSPTIPGRFPLRKQYSEAFLHERSSSVPGVQWRCNPFGDAMTSCVTGPVQAPVMSPASGMRTPPADPEQPKSRLGTPILMTRPLSPIISPTLTTKPSLKVDTSHKDGDDVPPSVPPKSPSTLRKGSPAPKYSARAGNLSATTPNPLSAISGNLSVTPNPLSAISPRSALEGRSSPQLWSGRTSPNPILNQHARNQSETSIMDRGRPPKKADKRERSRTCSEAKSPSTPATDNWRLPQGVRASEANLRFQEAEKESLRAQAIGQAEKFEVLSSRDVNALSRELRALDERCEYLRKTYKSLRAGRQKLHSRMISYLARSETMIFSRESLMKQEEALAELDISIDDWILKIEQAENRRLRVRQKLLEHVAAALVLHPAMPAMPSHRETAESTPPRSPDKIDSPNRVDRKDVESIKIYADGHVLSLFSDIEQAIGKMCEAC